MMRIDGDSVHLNGTFCCSREASRRMAAAGGGNMINMSRIMGTFGHPGGRAASPTARRRPAFSA